MRMSETRALATIDKQSAQLRSLREKAKEAAESTAATIAVFVGGAAGGYIEKKYGSGNTKWFGVDPGLAIGSALTVTGLMGWAGRSSDYIGSVGEGILAFEIGKRVYDKATV